MKYSLFCAALITCSLSYAMEIVNPQLKRGALIAIEGIDGSGKSTLARHLFATLEKKYSSVILTKEPGDTEVGKKIRE